MADNHRSGDRREPYSDRGGSEGRHADTHDSRLEPGGTFVDLNRLTEGPIKALGGHAASEVVRHVATRDTDFELWNRLIAQDNE